MSVVDLIAIGLAASAVNYLIFQRVNETAIGITALFAIAFEIFKQLSWRASIICRQCGFDPILYRRNPELARSSVKTFLEKKANQPLAAFARYNPLLKQTVASRSTEASGAISRRV